MSNLEDEIKLVVQDFVEQIVALADHAIVETVHSAAEGLRERPWDSDRPRRTAAEVESVAQRFMAYVRSHPGLHIEQLSKQLGTTRKDLVVPIRRLIAAGVVHTEGPKRWAVYFATPPRPDRSEVSVASDALGADAEPVAGQSTSLGDPADSDVLDGDWKRCLTDVFTFARRLQD